MPGLLLSGAGLLLLSRINVDIPNGDLVLGMCVLAAGVGLGMMPVMSSGLGAVPAAAAESASSFNTLVQRVSQAFGLGLLNAFLTVAGAQRLADRSGLLSGADPQVAGMGQNRMSRFGRACVVPGRGSPDRGNCRSCPFSRPGHAGRWSLSPH